MGRGGSSGRGGGGRSHSSRSSSSRSFSSRSSSRSSSGRGGRTSLGSGSRLGRGGGTPPGGGFLGPGRGPGPSVPPPRPPRRPRMPRTVFVHHSYGPRGNVPPYGSGNSGCLGFGGWIVLIILLIFLFIISASTRFGRTDDSITVSTTNREPLAAGICVESDEWYDDRAGWISSGAVLIDGLKTFYKETGVQPYLIIAEEIDGKGEELTDEEAEAYLQSVYDSLFQDEGHLIFLFLEYEPNAYKEYLYAGHQAAAVIDREAQEIIYDYADYYYVTDLEDDVYFATVFEKAAERIMTKTTTRNDIMRYAVMGLIALGFIGIVAWLIVKKKKADAAEAEEKRKILETPIEKMEDEELKKKYQK